MTRASAPRGRVPRDAGGPVVWPPVANPVTNRGLLAEDKPPADYPVLVSVPVAIAKTGVVMLTARWPHPGAPPASQCEGLELCVAQAGASLRNAQVHQELEVLKDELAHEAAHDALTGLANPRRFHERLERVCGKGRPGELVAVLFLDLDGLKQVNDLHGHSVGNQLLVAVAARLGNCARFGDLVARMGGDEFTIMLTRLSSPVPAYEVADRICDVLARTLHLRGADDLDLDQHRYRRRARRPGRSGRSRAPRGCRDVPGQTAGQGGVVDGPGLPRADDRPLVIAKTQVFPAESAHLRPRKCKHAGAVPHAACMEDL